MAKKEQAIQQPVEIDASKGVASLKELQKLVNELNKSLRITANIMKDLGGSHSVALAGALSPSRDMAGTNAAVKGFVQGTESMTALERRTAEKLSAKAAVMQQQVTNTASARQNDMSRYGTTRVLKIAEQESQVRRGRLDDYATRLSLGQTARADVQQAQAAAHSRWQERAAFTDNAPFRIKAAGAARQDVSETKHIQDNLNYEEATGFREDREKRIQGARTQGVLKRTAAAQAASAQRETFRQQAEADRKVKAADQAAARQQVTEEKAKRAEIDLKNRGGSTIDVIERRGAIQEGLIKLRASLKGSGGGGAGAGGGGAQGNAAAGSQLVGMLPGGGMLNRLGNMMPSVGRGIGAVGAWGSQSVLTTTAIGPALPNAAAGALGGTPLSGGGFVTAVGAGAGAVAGAVGLGLAAGVGGAVALGEYGQGKTEAVYGARKGRIMGMEATGRSMSALGGGKDLRASMFRAGGEGFGAMAGLDDPALLSRQAAFLKARGSSESLSPQDGTAWGWTMGNLQLDPSVAGMGSALGYSGVRGVRMAQRVHAAGADPNQLGSLFAHEQRAAGYGVLGSGVAEKNAAFAKTLAGSGFGGGQYGGIAAVQKLQGVGSGMADSIRGSMSQIGEALVLAKSVKSAGNLLGGLEGVDTMSAQEKFQAMQGSASVPALFGQRWSVAQASGRADRRLGEVEKGGFSGKVGEGEAAHQSTMDTMARQSETLNTLIALQRTLDKMNGVLADNIAFNKKYMETKTSAAAGLTGWFQ